VRACVRAHCPLWLPAVSMHSGTRKIRFQAVDETKFIGLHQN